MKYLKTGKEGLESYSSNMIMFWLCFCSAHYGESKMHLTSLTHAPLSIPTDSDVTFLYPKSRQYPFDEVCEKIVRTLERREWKVIGIKVKFDEFKSGKNTYRKVAQISGINFSLWFSRNQGRINSFTIDPAAVHKIVIPKRELTVFDDESGPIYHTYVGGNWVNDKQTFMNCANEKHKLKAASKLYLEPRKYLTYTGSLDPQAENGYPGPCYGGGIKRNPYLVNDDDLGREYRANEEEPKYFHTNQVYQEVQAWLESNVLSRL